jgi:putative nucleotidyltransferase with HDIG domain
LLLQDFPVYTRRVSTGSASQADVVRCRDYQMAEKMREAKNASFEFVKQLSADGAEDSPMDMPDPAASRAAAFEFVKRLAEDLSKGSFELPPFPDVALRVRDALSDPEVSVDKIGRIVLSEPVLSARLLRMANSAMLRRGSLEISDVKSAISRLGFDMVRNAAVSLAMDSTFKVPDRGPLRGHIEKTRSHSVRVAVLSYLLARRQHDSVKPDEAMLTGLLHDIGRFYILTRVDAFPAVFGHPDVLEELLQDWHTGIGRAIVESWGFPEEIAVAVDEHEILDREHFGKADLADVVLAANQLANRGEPGRAQSPPVAEIPSFAKLSLGESIVAEVLAESEQEIHSMSQALGG